MNKKMICFSVASLISCMAVSPSIAYDNENRNYTWAKNETKEKVKDFLREKFCNPGFFWDSYDDDQSERDAKTLYNILVKKSLENPENFKRVPVTTYVKKWNKERTLSDVDLKIQDELRKLIYKKIEKINRDFLSVKHQIADKILRSYRSGNEKQFIGRKLERKVSHEIQTIKNQQQKALKKQSHSGPMIKKHFTSDDCPICLEKFADIGKRIYLAPCGHDICPGCYAQYYEKCSLCRAKVTGVEHHKLQPSCNPECRC